MTEPLNIESFDAAPDYAANYLRTFFMGEPTLDEQHLMRFLAQEFARLPHDQPLLEVGCGPIVNHVLSAAPHVEHIDMADYRQDTLAEIQKWIERRPGAHSWRRFTRFALAAEGLVASEPAIDAREDLTRSRIRSLSTCDLRRAHPFGEPRTYPTVSCFYTTEQASRTREEWRSVFANLSGLVAGGGRLLCCATGHTDHYVIYDASGRPHRYPVPRLTHEDFTRALEENGFDMDRSRVTYLPLEGQESEGVYGVILVSAVRR